MYFEGYPGSITTFFLRTGIIFQLQIVDQEPILLLIASVQVFH
jgi:hypothetical protein